MRKRTLFLSLDNWQNCWVFFLICFFAPTCQLVTTRGYAQNRPATVFAVLQSSGCHQMTKTNKHVSRFSFDKVSQTLWCYQTSHFISHLSTLLFIRAAWHSQGCRQRIRWRCGSLTEHLLITALAEKLLVQCDSEPVKAAATVKQPGLNATKQSVKLMGTHLSRLIETIWLAGGLRFTCMRRETNT